MRLVDKTKSQVFLMECPCNLPFPFAKHNWFVINKKGVISRWESGFTVDRGEQSWGHLRKNDRDYKPFDGIYMFPFAGSPHWRGSLRATVEGENAERLIKIIESSPQDYPYCYKYGLLGPNSNTFIGWVSEQVPEANLRLSGNSIGKKYFYNHSN